jgi:glycerophosphoryl diester phosphodiesterase
MRNTPEVVAHRGASAYAPEHTYAAYDGAVAMGADALELDVRLAADGQPVVLHDRTLWRTARDRRPIHRVALGDLPPERRPLALDDVLSRYGASVGWLVELKDPCAALEDAVVGALAAHGLTAQRPSRASTTCRCAGSAGGPAGCASRRCCGRGCPGACSCRRSGAPGRGPARSACTTGRSTRSWSPPRAWTVNSPLDMGRLVEAGVDGLITDVPDVARAAVAGHLARPIAA